MRQVYRALGNLVALMVVVQMASIAMGWFITLHDVDGGQVFAGDDDFNVGHALHSIGALVVAALALLMLIVSFFAKVPGGVRWACFVVLAVLLQFVLAIVAFEVPVIGALHGVNALAVAGLASAAARRAKAVEPVEQAEPAAA